MRRGALSLLLLIACAPAAFARGRAPEWLKEVARAPLPAYPENTPGVILLDETSTSVNASGEIRVTRRRVIRILTTAGRDLAFVSVPFDSETKLTGMQAWAVTATGEEFRVKERDAIEASDIDEALYGDARRKVLRIPAAEPGNVIGFEYEQRLRTHGLQDLWLVGEIDVPVRRARYSLTLPAGWTYDARWFHGAAVAPKVAAAQSVWEVSDVAAVRTAPGMPALPTLVPTLALTFVPPTASPKPHRTWDDVALWYDALAASRRAATPSMREKTKELAGAATEPLEKMRALGKFAQHDIRYVAIEIGIGGYQPHVAQETFANRFGDCKDKVTLLMAMLREAGLDSYYVLVNTSRGVVEKDSPSMRWFNHVIAAIPLPPGVDGKLLHATVVHPKLGRLLLFDPTSELTPFGELPSYLQDSRGLLVTSGGGAMLDFAAHAPAVSSLTRNAKLTLGSDGTLTGTIGEVRTGSIAAAYRAMLQGTSPKEQTQMMEQRLANHLQNFAMRDLVIENLDDITKDLVVRFSFAATGYARRTAGMLLVRPRVIGTAGEPTIDLKDRPYGFMTSGPSLIVDEVEIALPPGVVAEELPEATNVSTPTLAYTSTSTFEAGKLRYRRRYELRRFDVPREGIEELNRAFAAILADERATALLR